MLAVETRQTCCLTDDANTPPPAATKIYPYDAHRDGTLVLCGLNLNRFLSYMGTPMSSQLLSSPCSFEGRGAPIARCTTLEAKRRDSCRLVVGFFRRYYSLPHPLAQTSSITKDVRAEGSDSGIHSKAHSLGGRLVASEFHRSRLSRRAYAMKRPANCRPL